MYQPQSWYFSRVRNSLQDTIAPYRHDDHDLNQALNACVSELARLRVDIFLDLKYQGPLRKGDTGNGFDDVYFALDGNNAAPAPGSANDTLMPIPRQYQEALVWGASGYVQFLDVTDTQDQRAQGFLQKFHTHLVTLSAA